MSPAVRAGRLTSCHSATTFAPHLQAASGLKNFRPSLGLLGKTKNAVFRDFCTYIWTNASSVIFIEIFSFSWNVFL